MIQFTNRFVTNLFANDSLTGFLKNKSDTQEKNISFPKDYFLRN